MQAQARQRVRNRRGVGMVIVLVKEMLREFVGRGVCPRPRRDGTPLRPLGNAAKTFATRRLVSFTNLLIRTGAS
jgi:hypothetical protein